MESNQTFQQSGSGVELVWLMEWKYGPAKQQTNQSSTKSKCLCFVVLIDGCVALVAAPQLLRNCFRSFSPKVLFIHFCLSARSLAAGSEPRNSIQLISLIWFHCLLFAPSAGFHSLHSLNFIQQWAPLNLYIPLLALHVINFMYLFILHKNIQLWLLDSYPLHINYCYNIFYFISPNSMKEKKSEIVWESEDNWAFVWLSGLGSPLAPLLWLWRCLPNKPLNPLYQSIKEKKGIGLPVFAGAIEWKQTSKLKWKHKVLEWNGCALEGRRP